MGYSVWPSGRVRLAATDDGAAVEAVKAAWAAQGGDGPWEIPGPADTLADIAWVAAASVVRDGDWIEFRFDDTGDPKWSDAATAVYVAIAPFVREGTVHIDGDDGSRWSYSYADGQVKQHGWNGWDASLEPFGEPQNPPVEPRARGGAARALVVVLIGLVVVAGAAVLLAKVR